MAANSDNAVDFVVLLAGIGLTGEEIFYFQVPEAETGSPVEYGKSEETMSPRLVKLVSSRILERFGPS